MRAVDIIQKRDGLALNKEEIEWLIGAMWLEQYQITKCLLLLWPFILKGWRRKKFLIWPWRWSKRGTGLICQLFQGSGWTNTRLVVWEQGNLGLGAFGCEFQVPVAKMSGRGSHTGGTIDKLESIKGFQIERTRGIYPAGAGDWLIGHWSIRSTRKSRQTLVCSTWCDSDSGYHSFDC